MRRIINLIIVISILVIILIIFIPIFPSFFNKISISLSNLSTFFNYLAMVFAAFALLIACFAYKSAIMRPDLKLKIFAWGNENEGPTLLINKKTQIVSSCHSLTEWHFILENTGEASAKYPVVQIDFHNAFFSEDDFPGWKAIHLANALGRFGFQWSPEENMVIHPNLQTLLPIMLFSNKSIYEIPLNITIVADGFRKKNYKVPVKIEFEYDIDEKIN